MNEAIYQEIARTKLLPLYTVTNISLLDTLEKVLLENDMRLIEIPFRSEQAIEAIAHLSKSGKLYVGAGTIRTLEQAKEAKEHGAQFIVSPSFVQEVVDYCLESNLPVFPGVATPSDIQRAVDAGIKTLKFFPADIYGGLKAIQALSGPFYDVQFIPTGGVTTANLSEYLTNSAVLAVGGSFIISEARLAKSLTETAAHLKEMISEIRDIKKEVFK